MSEGIIIALITAFGSLLGGIIGQIITASATIEAAKIKEKINLSPNGENNAWRRVVFGAIIGAVVTLIILFSLGMIPPKSESQPSESPPIVITENTLTEASEMTNILAYADLEGGKTQQITYIDKEWQIIVDEAGNKIYDVNNSKGNDWPRIHLGSDDWKDYEVSFQTRIISGTSILVYFRESESPYKSYVVDVRLDSVSLHASIGGNWNIITSRQNNLQKNQWYSINIRARGSEIKITVDDKVVIFTDDTTNSYGRVDIQVSQYTYAQFKEMKVISVEK
jgi:hypothetical protein